MGPERTQDWKCRHPEAGTQEKKALACSWGMGQDSCLGAGQEAGGLPGGERWHPVCSQCTDS